MIARKRYMIGILIIMVMAVSSGCIHTSADFRYSSPKQALNDYYTRNPNEEPPKITFEEIHIDPDTSVIFTCSYNEYLESDIITGHFFVQEKDGWSCLVGSMGLAFPTQFDWKESDGIIYREDYYGSQNTNGWKKRNLSLDVVFVYGESNINEIEKFADYIKIEPELPIGDDIYWIWYKPV